MKLKFLILTLLPIFYCAQITTDRPGFGTGTDIVGKGILQLENGLNYLHDNDDFSTDLLLRYGITKAWEVRVKTIQDFNNSEDSSYLFSSKYNFLSETDSAPALTAVVNSDFKLENYTAFLSASKSFASNLSLQTNLGYKKKERENYLFFISTFGYSLSDEWSLFAEYSGNYSGNFKPDHNADFGVSFIPTNRLEFDLSAGSALDNVSKNYFLNAGFSYVIFK